MKHLAAYLLLRIGGNTDPSASEIRDVLASVGIDADEKRLNTLLTEFMKKDVDELIAEGSSKLAVGIGYQTGGPALVDEPALGRDHDVGGDSGGDNGDMEVNDEDEDGDFGLGLFG